MKGKKYTHQEFMDKFKERNEHFDDIEVLGEYVNAKTKITCRCKICNYEWNALPYNLMQGHGCYWCAAKYRGEKNRKHHSKHKTKKRETIKDYSPHLVEYLANPDDAINYTAHSGKKILVRCVDCGHEKEIAVKDFTKYGFSCSVCSDKMSYPNKYLRQLLKQLAVDIVRYEYSPAWVFPYRYDGYFEKDGVPYLVEMDGAVGHGEKQYKSTKQDVEGMKRDRIKDELARTNNIELIRIDCKKSNSNYISENIKNSRLNEIFDLTNVDWNECNINSQKNLIKEVCEYRKNTKQSLRKIAEYFNLGKTTVRRYLICGSQFGWCEYNTRELN